MYLPVIFSTVVHSQKVYHIRTIVHDAGSDSGLNVGFLGCMSMSLLSPGSQATAQNICRLERKCTRGYGKRVQNMQTDT